MNVGGASGAQIRLTGDDEPQTLDTGEPLIEGPLVRL